MVNELTLFDLDDDATIWRPIFNSGQTCRDCGRTKFVWERGCGGAYGGGAFNLCDDCAALDGVGERRDPAEGDVSRWGIRTTEAERSRLVGLQARRRVAWLRANAVRS